MKGGVFSLGGRGWGDLFFCRSSLIGEPSCHLCILVVGALFVFKFCPVDLGMGFIHKES